jgi:hypothetical protein
MDPINFSSTKAAAVLQSDRINPKLGDLRFTLNVDVRGLIAITGVEEEAIRT